MYMPKSLKLNDLKTRAIYCIRSRIYLNKCMIKSYDELICVVSSIVLSKAQRILRVFRNLSRK